MNIYVGNVPYAATEEDLETLFSEYGSVATVTIIYDRYDGRSKGFGFVEMENQEDGERAIKALNGQEMMGRPLKVNPARPRGQRNGSWQKRPKDSNGQIKSKSPLDSSQNNSPFHNPYTFIPTPPREKAVENGGFAGDFSPLKCGLDHATLKEGCWTGHIPIELTTVTPLVLLDAGGEDRLSDTHQTYDVLNRIPESSLRGMLRSAYEVVTNSRYGNFSKDEPLEYSAGPKKREKYDKSPLELLDLSLHPASSLDTLSPADRLFGWVPSLISSPYHLRNIQDLKQHARRVRDLTKNEKEQKDATAHAYVYQSLLYLKNHDPNSFDELTTTKVIKEIYDKCEKRAKRAEGGYKSRLRVVCEDGARPEIIQRFEDSLGNNKHLPLTILSEPKPTYGRFYVAKDTEGTPQDNGCLSKKEAGYSDGKGLRGRKQYWHHRGLEAEQAPDHWKPLIDKQTQKPNQKGLYQESIFRSEDGSPEKDHQNRSIRGWIKPGTRFKASLYVQNLEPEEVGALLWLLTLPKKYYFRLGYGKPLGFGSVKIKIDKTQCVNGCLPLGKRKDWKEYYASLDETLPATVDKSCCIRKFKESMVAAYTDKKDLDDQQLEECFKALPFIKGFLQVLCGPETEAPIHYPRKESKPSSEAKSLEWFKANDSEKKGEEGGKLSLPDVTGKDTLPNNPTKE